MVIQHNLSALNSHRTMGVNNSKVSKNLEKLSSGFKVNRAGDDAAGLAISEKMRGQMRGLAMAEQNVSNGISLIQTAEGGLNETHAILQRMRELAVQSANGTYVEGVDRAQLEKEFTAIKSEIDRISQSTAYNGINLLDGTLGINSKVPVVDVISATGNKVTAVAGTGTSAETKQVITVGAGALGTGAAGINQAGNVFNIKYQRADGSEGNFSHTLTTADILPGAAADLNSALQKEFGDDFTVALTVAGTIITGVTFTAKEASDDQARILSVYMEKGTATGTAAPGIAAITNTTAGKAANVQTDGSLATAKYLHIDGKKFQFVKDDSELDAGYEALYVSTKNVVAQTDINSLIGQLKSKGYNVSTPAVAAVQLNFSAKNGKGVEFQIGANGSADQRVDLSVGDMSSKAIGTLDSSGKIVSSVAGSSIATQDAAKLAVDVIEDAINQVSGTRADLGALQNRLEHTMNNLGVTKENITAAESSIRDVDMAKEMMEFTKNNILVQASQAMLAQANQLPQGVLQLLR